MTVTKWLIQCAQFAAANSKSRSERAEARRWLDVFKAETGRQKGAAKKP